jgi:hypothetical protein
MDPSPTYRPSAPAVLEAQDATNSGDVAEFVSWKERMILFLRYYDFWDIVKDGFKTPTFNNPTDAKFHAAEEDLWYSPRERSTKNCDSRLKVG